MEDANNRSSRGARRHGLDLTEAEALALLDACLMSYTEDTDARSAAMAKLADLCRTFLAAKPTCPPPNRPAGDYRVVYRLRQTPRGLSARY